MSSTDAAIGMMDGAYFVGRNELLHFFNTLLDMDLKKIEETAPGHVACQICDLIFPGSVKMDRVNWEARSDYEFVQNYKLLQAAFNKHRVQRHVDVDKLIRAKYQDNLEFCQWLKAFYDQTAAPVLETYDAAAVRAKGRGGRAFNQKHGSGKGKARGGSGTTLRTGATTTTTRPSRPLRERTAQNGGGTMAGGSGSVGTKKTMTAPASPGIRPTASTDSSAASPAQHSSNNNHEEVAALEQQVQQLQEEVAKWQTDHATLEDEKAEWQHKATDLESTLEELEKERDQIVMDVEKERDFYFGKLRNIEVMLQVHQEQPHEEQLDNAGNLVDRVFQILYATAEDNLTVNEKGQVVEAAEEDLNVLLQV